MTFFLRMAKGTLTLPVLTVLIPLRWAGSIVLLLTAVIPGTLALIPAAALSNLIIRQQSAHGDVPRPIMRATYAVERVAEKLFDALGSVLDTSDLLLGANPIWPPASLFPRTGGKSL